MAKYQRLKAKRMRITQTLHRYWKETTRTEQQQAKSRASNTNFTSLLDGNNLYRTTASTVQGWERYMCKLVMKLT